MKTGIIVVIVLAILGIGGYELANHSSTPKASPKPATTQGTKTPAAASDTTNTPASNSSSTAQTATSFTVNANDETADQKSLSVKKGDQITVTFKVDTNEVYHGGLEFRSDVVSSKPIKPGGSDTVTFTADKSFDFTPYWYQSNIQKSYLIHVNVAG